MLTFKLDDRAFQKALRDYAKVSSLKLPELIKKRATRLFFRLFMEYRAVTPSKAKLDNVAESLGYALKVRNSIRFGKRKRTRGQQVKAEIGRRKSARFYNSLGWLQAAKKAGLDIRKQFKNEHPNMGKGKSRLRGSAPFVEIENLLEGAPHIEDAHNVVKKALREEAADMRVYINRKLRAQTKRAKL